MKRQSSLMEIRSRGEAESAEKRAKADRVIARLKEKAIAAGVWEDRSVIGGNKYNDLGKRGYQWATPPQCRKVEAMFREISYYKNDPKAFEHAFRNFLSKIAHVDDVKFLEKKDVQKVVKALERMKAQKQEGR